MPRLAILSQRASLWLPSKCSENSTFQSSFASVSVDNHILAPLRNLLNGVPEMLRLQRLPTGEKGKEEERKSGVAEASCGPLARKYILLLSSSE